MCSCVSYVPHCWIKASRFCELHVSSFLAPANVTEGPTWKTVTSESTLLILWRKPERRVQSAVVRRWSSSGIRRLRGVDSGEKRIAPHSLPRGWSRQIHSRPSAQPTISPLRGVHARAHRWRSAGARHDRRAIAARSDSTEDCRGARVADDVSQGARAGNRACHVGECHGQFERGAELRPCTTAEGELTIHLGLLDVEEDLIDWETDLEIELPPLLSPSFPLVPSSPPSSLVPLSSPKGAPEPPVPAPRKWTPVPCLQSALQCPLLENAHPPTHFCLLHRCRLAAPLLALSPPSMRCELGGTAILQRRRGRSFPRLCLQPPRPGLRLGLLTRRLHHGS